MRFAAARGDSKAWREEELGSRQAFLMRAGIRREFSSIGERDRPASRRKSEFWALMRGSWVTTMMALSGLRATRRRIFIMSIPVLWSRLLVGSSQMISFGS